MQILGHSRGAILQLAERLRDCNVRLRWGGQQQPGAVNGSCHLADGLEQLQAFSRNEVPTIRYTTDPVQRDLWVAEGHKVLGRTLHHTQGRDIVWPSQSKSRNAAWQKRDFWTVYRPAVQEWRIHIVDGHSIARGLKHFVPQEVGAELEQAASGAPIIRSRRLGWVMRHDIVPPKSLRDIAKQAVKSLGYQLGAVDILQLTTSKTTEARLQYAVLEVNSRPAIRDEYTLAAYEKALRKLA